MVVLAVRQDPEGPCIDRWLAFQGYDDRSFEKLISSSPMNMHSNWDCGVHVHASTVNTFRGCPTSYRIGSPTQTQKSKGTSPYALRHCLPFPLQSFIGPLGREGVRFCKASRLIASTIFIQVAAFRDLIGNSRFSCCAFPMTADTCTYVRM